MHTTAWDWLWEGDETLKWVSIHAAWLNSTHYCNIDSSFSPRLMGPRGLRVTQTTYMFFTIKTCQATFISDIMRYSSRHWKKNGSETCVRRDRRTDRCENWNSHLDDFSAVFRLLHSWFFLGDLMIRVEWLNYSKNSTSWCYRYRCLWYIRSVLIQILQPIGQSPQIF